MRLGPALTLATGFASLTLTACDRGPRALEPTPSAAESEVAPLPAPPPAGQFEVVLDNPSALFRVGKALLVAAGSGPGLAFYRAETEGLTPLPLLTKGLPPEEDPAAPGAIERIAGRFPEALWLSWRVLDTWSGPENAWRDTLFRWKGDRWAALGTTEDDEVYQTFWEASPLCLLGLLTDSWAGQGGQKAREVVADCPPGEAPPLAYPGGQNLPLRILDAVGMASGALALLEAAPVRKGPETAAPRLTLWGPAKGVSTSVTLPLSGGVRGAPQPVGFFPIPLQVTGGSEVVVGGTYAAQVETPGGVVGKPLETFLARSDGASLRPIEGLSGCDHDDASQAEDGALFVVSATSEPCDAKAPRRLVRLRPDGSLLDLGELPRHPKTGKPLIARHVAARSASDAWVSAETAAGSRVLVRWRGP